MRFIPSLDILLAFFDGLDKKKLLKATMATTTTKGIFVDVCRLKINIYLKETCAY